MEKPSMTKIPVRRNSQMQKELFRRRVVLSDIDVERNRQNEKWGKQVHPFEYWYAILGEEFGEVGQAIQKGSYAHKTTDASDLYKELIQVAAVAAAIAEQVLENE